MKKEKDNLTHLLQAEQTCELVHLHLTSPTKTIIEKRNLLELNITKKCERFKTGVTSFPTTHLTLTDQSEAYTFIAKGDLIVM